ncbi:MAG TPA: tetratricopeptide repeat protein [Devosia sp.]
MFSIKYRNGRKTLALATAMALALSWPAQAQLFKFPSNEPTAETGQAQGDPAQLVVRIQQLEEQLRTVNGQVEGLTFQLTQMQELLTRTTQAYEARLNALEGGSAAAPAAPAQGAATTSPSEANVPATEIPPQGVQPLPGETEFDPTFTDGAAPTDEIGNSADPLVGTGAAGGVDLATGQPLDLNYNPQNVSTGDADADAQFTAGVQALDSGDYAFAETQFTQFLELYPDNAQAVQASSYLGDALMQRSAYSEAADVLLNAFQQAPSSPQAPDLLLKLGMSLSGAGERETACRTFAEVDKRYTTLAPAFVTRLAAEKTKAECPPA